MGFFGDLKQDLSQAVNELLPEENAAEEVVENKEENQMEADIDLEKMLEDALSSDMPLYEDPDAGKASESEEEIGSSAADMAVDDAFADLEAISNQAAMQDAEAKKEDAYKEDEGITDTFEDNNFKGVDWKMDSNTERGFSDETSVITLGMTVNGDITAEGSLEILGNVKGNIDVSGKLNVTGHITGNSKAHEIFAENAKINGDVVSESSIKIGAGTVIVGNISGFSAAVAGAVKGDIDVHGPVILDSSAIVMGNIRSKSVQINNGAAIEGMCSQCYADVSPTAFFDDYKPETGSKKSKNN